MSSNDRFIPARLPAPALTILCVVAAAGMAACQGRPAGHASGVASGSNAASAERQVAAVSTPDAPPTSTAIPRDTTPADSSTVHRYDVSELGVNYGAPSAPIQVVEFSDFGCPHCRAFQENTYPTLYREYVQTGKVIWKYVPLVLGIFPNSLDAARAGQCAIEQGDFAPMRDELFSHQADWENVDADSAKALFLSYARDSGLDVDSLQSCVGDENGQAEKKVRDGIQVARQVGVQGTPTFFIQGQKLQGDRPVSAFRDIFQQILDKQGAGGSN